MSSYYRVKKYRLLNKKPRIESDLENDGDYSSSNSSDGERSGEISENLGGDENNGSVQEAAESEKSSGSSTASEEVEGSFTGCGSDCGVVSDSVNNSIGGRDGDSFSGSDGDSFSGSDSSYYSHDSETNSEADSDSSLEADDSDVDALPPDPNPIEDLKKKLKFWEMKNSITLKALSELLVLISFWLSFHCQLLTRWLRNFPKDARTLLGTTAEKFSIRRMLSQRGDNGEYVYFGLSKALREIVDERFFPDSTITLSINMDGIPLYRSSSVNLWPILSRIFCSKYKWKPFPVAIYSGPGKPASVEDYLSDFVDELTTLLADGITIKNNHFSVKIASYICDTPARAFVKCCASHGGFFCCERCHIKGITRNRKRVYPDRKCTLRTDESFLQKQQEDHHTGTSPLSRVPGFLPVSSFLLDSMHLLWLGVMRRLLNYYWVAPNKTKKNVTLRPSEIRRLVKIIGNLRACISYLDFPRKIGYLADLSRYKVTEYRFFLLYCGPIVLKDVLNNPLFKHFLLLHVATRILYCPVRSKVLALVNYSKQLYEHFFDLLPELYGNDSQIINMHNLTHVADDVVKFKCTLDELSGFDFENELGLMKKKLRSSNRPLAQYCRRFAESGYNGKPTLRGQRGTPRVYKRVSDGTRIKICYLNFTVSIFSPDNFVFLDDGNILEIQKIRRNKGQKVLISGALWTVKTDLFTFPCASSSIGEWKISGRRSSSMEWEWDLDQITAKLIRFRVGEDVNECNYTVVILHTCTSN